MAIACRVSATAHVYNREFQKWLRWLTMNENSRFWAAPGAALLCQYVTWMCSVPPRVKPQTAKNYLAGVAAVVQDMGYDSPVRDHRDRPLRLLVQVWAGLKKKWATAVKHKLAVSCDMVLEIRGCPVFEATLHNGRCYWAAVCLAAVMGLRISEYTAVTVRGDSGEKQMRVKNIVFGVTTGGEKFFDCTVSAAKNDIARIGFTHRVWEDGSGMCPYQAMRRYWSTLPGGVDGDRPLFQLADGKNLTRATFTNALRSGLKFAGYHPERYSAHSLRAGAAVSVACANYGADVIKRQGRWKSSCYQDYLQFGDAFLREVQFRMTAVNGRDRQRLVGDGLVTNWNEGPWAE
jgi:hypothetical protein